MIPVKHIDPDDLPLYAMQLLPPDEMEEMSLHLQHSAEARRVLSEFYGDLAAYAHTADMHSPPALARQRLMKHVAREKKAIPFPAQPEPAEGAYAPRGIALVEDAPTRSMAARVLPWIGWPIAAGLAASTILFQQRTEHYKIVAAQSQSELKQTIASTEQAQTVLATVKDPAAVQVMLAPPGVKTPPQGRTSYDAETGSLVFLASNLDPLQNYKTYELWVIPADGRDAIPAGTFHPDEHGNASVVLPKLPRGVMAKTFGVTIEDGEGSSQPTMPIILKGTAS